VALRNSLLIHTLHCVDVASYTEISNRTIYSLISDIMLYLVTSTMTLNCPKLLLPLRLQMKSECLDTKADSQKTYSALELVSFYTAVTAEISVRCVMYFGISMVLQVFVLH